VPLLHAFLNALRPAAGQPPSGSPSPPASQLDPGAQRRRIDPAASAEQPADADGSRFGPDGGLIGEQMPGAEQPAAEPAHFQVSYVRQGRASVHEFACCWRTECAMRLALRAYTCVCAFMETAAQAVLRYKAEMD